MAQMVATAPTAVTQTGSRRRVIAVGILLAGAALGFLAWMELQLGGDFVTTAVDDIGEGVAAAVAALSCALAAARTQGRLRRAWALLAASAATWSAGEAVWSVYEVWMRTTVPTPSLADIGFLAAIPLAIAGVVSFASTARGTSTGVRLWLDRSIVALSLTFVGWELGLSNVFTEPGVPLLSRLVNIAYPVGDILIGTVLLLAIRRATDETQGRLLLILAGLAANALSDSTFAYLNLNDTFTYVLDSGWVFGYLTIALAAWLPSAAEDRTAEDRPIDVWQLALPWVAILAGGIAAIVEATRGQPLDTFATVLAGVVIALLMASQVVAHNESLTLLIKSRLSAATLNEVIVYAPLGVMRLSRDLEIQLVNPSFGSILACDVDRVIGTRVDRFFPDSEMVLIRERLATLAAGSAESTQMDTQGIRADGTAIWLQWTASAVQDRAGELDYYLVMLQDVSERRSTEDALKAAYAEMEALVAQRTAELRAANERLTTEAISDPLTGLYNRRYLEDFVARELSRTRRAGHKTVFVLIDIDHFKRFNDTYGHDAGDEVLKIVSAFLRGQIRQEDLAFRYGGEEFLLVLPTTAVDAVAGRIDQVRERIARRTIEFGGQSIGPITFSLGVAAFPDHGDTAEAVIASADDALYRAKQGGRNRVEYVGQSAPQV